MNGWLPDPHSEGMHPNQCAPLTAGTIYATVKAILTRTETRTALPNTDFVKTLSQSRPSEAFLLFIKDHLPNGDGIESVDPETPLADQGLDSLSSIDLLLEIESATGTGFPDEYLTAAVFRTATTLWAALREVMLQAGCIPKQPYSTVAPDQCQ